MSVDRAAVTGRGGLTAVGPGVAVDTDEGRSDAGIPGPRRAREVRFGAAGTALPVRVVLDPMPTLLTSLVEWFGPLRSRVPVPIRRQAAALARQVDIGPLAAMVVDPLHRGSPDFLTRMNLTVPVPTVRDSTGRVRAEPEDAVLQDIDLSVGAVPGPGGRNPVAARWHRDPQRALTDLCQALDRYWYGVLMHIYPDTERRLRRAVTQLQDAVTEVGPQAALASLHPRVRLDLAGTSSVSLPGQGGGAAAVPVTGLVIKPMIANRLTLCTNLLWGPRVAAFAVPTPGLTVAAAPPAGDPLTLLLGPSRAGLLRRLEVRPATTTGLSEASGLGPSTVSHHLGSLREAGVVAPQRQGQCVLYALTERGHRLLGVG